MMRKSSSYTRMTRQRPSRLPLAVAICLAMTSPSFGQETTSSSSAQPTKEEKATSLGTVTVTAQKREENLQKVPISIQVLSTVQLEQQNVNDFEDYARLLPSVSFTPFGPGFGQVYMRGVSNGGDGNHSTSLPSVGVYLDEQPITTIQGPLDIHVYDIARVEALSGPQGTLYGASSQAGTLRIITNKPDSSGFAAGFGVEVNGLSHGGMGHVLEGFVNVPMGPNAALRAVAWQKHDAGYVDNVLGTRTYPTWDDYTGGNGTVDNAAVAKDDYNDADTVGGRVALRFDLSDNWTITPTIMAQHQETNGAFQYDPVVGDLEITHFRPESSEDRWSQAALTVQGKIGNFDLTYAFAHLNRRDEVESDYNDYSFWYDTLYGYGAYWYDDNYDIINPTQYIQGKDEYRKTSHELRISSPSDDRLRLVAGLFWQDHFHDIQQRYKIDGLGSQVSITGWEDTLWLTKQERRDHDEAVFGEISYDFTDKLTATAGMRYFRARNSLQGFFGFGRGYAGVPDPADYDTEEEYQIALTKAYGEAKCEILYGPDSSTWDKYNGAPCSIFNKEVRESGSLGRVNVTYEIDDTHLIYATWSEGYRPGGVQRRGILPNYKADFLTNWEFGWKTSWMNNRLILNGSVFQEDWKNFQFSVLGLNGLTDIRNAAQAQIRGMEMDLSWAATYNLLISGGFSYYDAKLTADYCGFLDLNEEPITECPAGTINPQTGDPVDGPEAPAGTRLPVTARLKGNLTARYTWEMRGMEAHWQTTFAHEGNRTSDLRIFERGLIGSMPAYDTVDLSFGVKKNNWSLDFFVKNVFDERGQLGRFFQCSEAVCGNAVSDPAWPVPSEYANGQVYIIPSQPRTFGIRWSQEF